MATGIAGAFKPLADVHLTPYVADLNRRPLGYEPKGTRLTPIEINSLTGSQLAKTGRNAPRFVSKLLAEAIL